MLSLNEEPVQDSCAGPTVGGLEAVHQPDGQVAFGPELSSFLPHVDHQLSKTLALIKLKEKRQLKTGKNI